MKYTAIFNKDKVKKAIQHKINIYEFSIMAIIFLLILILIKIFI
jgi:hypothetical protein